MANNKQLKLLLSGFTLIIAIVIVSLSIATLVKVYEKPKSVVDNANGKNPNTQDGLQQKPNIVNVQPPVTISPQASKFSSFKAYAKTLKDSLNTSIDPCEDFFLYTCGSYAQPMSFSFVQANNMMAVAKHARKDQSTDIGKKGAYHFSKCVEAHKNTTLIHKEGQTIADIYADFKKNAGIEFPLFNSSWTDINKFPSPTLFGKVMGYLSGIYGVDTFVSIGVDTNWKQPSDMGINSYELYVDQTKLAFVDTYYIKAWSVIKDDYKNKTLSLLNDVAKYVNVNLDPFTLEQDINDMFDMEVTIATQKNTLENVRRNYERQRHEITIADANKNYPLLDFKTYISNAMTYASREAKDVVTAPNYKININEPDQLLRLTKYLKDELKPRTIYNYLFFRLLRANQDFMPQNQQSTADKWMREDQRLGRKRKEKGISHWRTPRAHPSEVADNDLAIDVNCAGENAVGLWYINARFFLMEMLPTQDQRDDLKKHVAKLVSSVLEGFQNQIDQLDWMGDTTKTGAYSKIKYLVRNIGYPEGVLSEDWLADYYKELDFSFSDDYLAVLQSINKFMIRTQFETLTIKTGTIRDDFGGPSSIVNAWYQPEMNSITFPLGILQQPFYDINYPAAVNFGAMGVIAGHELTHGFDDEGVQWDAFGRLKKWIDDKSQVSFDEMANCTDTQYSGFIPTPGFNVDGRQTLGENLADNGGIRAAYNAFEAHQNYWGPDARLPDNNLDAFTPEQLFFLGFARVWCEINPPVERLQKQVLVDPHSPSQFRVQGTLQNFPAFRAAFNCPVGKKYSPPDNEHCNVWASEVKVVTGIPPIDTPDASGKVNNINPPDESDKESYGEVAKRLKAAVNVSVSPCDDFQQYACGKYDQTAPTAVQKAHGNVRSAALDTLGKPVSDKDSAAVGLAKAYYTQCKKYVSNPDNRYITSMVSAVEALLAQDFPTFKAEPKMKPLDPRRLGSTLGSIWAVYHSEIFVSLDIKSLHKHYYLEAPNAVYIDQPKLTFPQKWYIGKKQDDLKVLLKTYIKNVFTRYAAASGRTASDAILDKDVQDLVDYEVRLASTFLRDEYQRIPDYNRTRLEVVLTTYKGISYFDYLTRIIKSTGVSEDVQNAIATLDWVVEAPKYFDQLDKELTSATVNAKLRIIYNYIFYRLLDSNQVFLDGNKPPPFAVKPNNKDVICGEAINAQLAPVYSQAAIDKIYIVREKFRTDQKNVAEIADNVQHGFSTMIDALSWIPLSARKQAHLKTESMVRNIGVPDFVLDDAKLDAYYKGFSFTKPDDFISMVIDLKLFSKRKQLQKLTSTQGIDRTEFLFNLYSDPIWSAYDLNSITFTLDVLQAPVYSADYPSALNFGLLGSLIGHEIGHAFDEVGINFNWNGQLVEWFDRLDDHYHDMTKCLNTQYSIYCPTSTDKSACILDADDTLNDNLADNTGLQAALRGFRNWINIRGQDKRLPDSDGILDRFTNEQLFFLGYAQQYCPKTDYFWYNFGAKQSPNEYRLLGTLSNSQTFRSAFNCPVGRKYSPQATCKVWTSDDINPNLGVPDTGTEHPLIGIPANEKSNSPGYQACAATLEYSLDTTVDPCDDFYGYVCRRYQGDGAFMDVIYKNQDTLVKKLKDAPEPGELQAIKLERLWFNKCVNALGNWKDTNKNADLIQKHIKNFETAMGIKFPLASNNPALKDGQYASPENFGKAIGWINRNIDGVDPIVYYFTFTDIISPDLGYRIYLGAVNLLDDVSNYLKRDWLTKYKPGLVAAYADLIQKYFKAAGITGVTKATIFAEADKMATLEWVLAQGQGPDSEFDDGIYNPLTVENATQYFPQTGFNLKSMLTELAKGVKGMGNEGVSLDSVFNDPDYVLMFQQPDNYMQFTNQVNKLGDYNIDDNTLWNYLVFTIIAHKSNYLPKGNELKYHEFHQKSRKPKGFPKPGIQRKIPDVFRGHSVFDKYDMTYEEYSCSMTLGDKFTEIHNRVFVNAVFSDEAVREDTRTKIATYAEAIAVSFRAMVDQLTWLTKDSKKGAYGKLDLFVRNILYPNQTYSDDFMNEYYKDLKWDDTNTFLDMQVLSSAFAQGKDLEVLTITDGADRTEFGDTSQVNAFYRPYTNSITICAGIIQPPFYDSSWPTAINYGAIGLVVGHEITHGFDNGGVMWDGQGAYHPWMDKKSQREFNKMAQCVIKEYNGKDFCKAPGYCVNGEETQGENIADNGGIQSAFRAYRSHVGIHGEDPSLPGEIAGQFTNDQLFFIGFTRNWCEEYYQPPQNYNWHEPHSPGPYRIYGTLQNFAEFRSAFNCPTGAKYAPKDPCKVWISDVNPHLMLPTAAPLIPKINIPEPVRAGDDNVNFKQVSDYLVSTIDVQQSPCNNFYEYSCNKLRRQPSNAQIVNMNAAKAIIEGMPVDQTKSYNKLIKDYQEQCAKTLNAAPDAATVQPFIADFKSKNPTIGFPLFDGTASAAFGPDELATAIGYLAGTQAINTLIDARVVPFLKPGATDPKYILSVGEPVLTQPIHAYEDDNRVATRGAIVSAFVDVLKVYRDKIITNTVVTDKQILDAAISFYNIEYTLASKSRNFNDRNDATKFEHPIIVTNLKTTYPIFNWDKFFEQLAITDGTIVTKLKDGNTKVSVVATDKINDLFTTIKDVTKIPSNNLANYFNFRALWDLRTSLFQAPNDGSGDLPVLPDQVTLNSYICALETRDLSYIHSNIYVRKVIGNDAKVTSAREEVAKVGNRVIGALKAQVLQVEWLTDDIKKKAAAKFDSLILNAVVDPNAFNDATLTAAYPYTQPTPLNPQTLLDTVRKMMLKQELGLLNAAAEIKRTDFVGSSSSPTPIYDALTNSLNVPASLVVQPFYDANNPLASNYGGLGYLIAHALAHSFDKFGIQFNKDGGLDALLDAATQTKFNNVTTCLTVQYNKICPLTQGAFAPNCLDGVQTLNENIADNAGIHAAYSAYLAAANYKGEDPRLNHNILGQFTESQLFFLSYARDYCAKQQSDADIFAGIVGGNKNPPNLRILASLRNYPAFKSAFNCPAQTSYAPDAKDICNVWVTESSSVARQTV